MFLCPEETGRYKIFASLEYLLRWAVKFDGQSFLYAEFYNDWGYDGEAMLEICPTLQIFLDVDGECGKAW